MVERNKIQSPENEIICIDSFQQESQFFFMIFQEILFQ